MTAGRRGRGGSTALAALSRWPSPRLLLAAARPRQWPKNLLVLAAPGAAGLLSRPGPLARTSLAAVLFLAASAGIYLLNDVLDAAADRAHPDKRHRPVASGALSPTVAVGTGAVLLLVALAGAGLLAGPALAEVLGAYVVVSVLYAWRPRPSRSSSSPASRPASSCGPWPGAPRSTSPSRPGSRSSPRPPPCSWSPASAPPSWRRSVRQGRRTARCFGTTPALPPVGAPPRAPPSPSPATRCGPSAGGRARPARPGRRRPVLPALASSPSPIAILTLELAFEHGAGGAPEELALQDRGLQLLGLACLGLLVLGIYT